MFISLFCYAQGLFLLIEREYSICLQKKGFQQETGRKDLETEKAWNLPLISGTEILKEKSFTKIQTQLK